MAPTCPTPEPRRDAAPPVGDPVLTVRDEAASARPSEPAGPGWPCVSGYRLERELGRGGMGIVYLARELALDRPVAIKTILAGDQASPLDLARFRTEAEAVARLQHAGIVQIYAVGQAGGRPFLALEFCAGGSLQERLDGTPVTPTDAAAIAEALARAVQHAHERGVVHRDLKPANILLQGAIDVGANLSSAALKITDFGLAKRLDRGAAVTHSKAILGTPNYMAPEQARPGPHPVGAAADVWALGAILFELVTGRPPFSGATVLGTLDCVARDEPMPPTRLRPGCPRDLETIILTCLRKDPGQRYARAADLAEDCAAFRRGDPILARPESAWGRAVRWVRRRPAGVGLVAAVLAVVALAGTLARQGGELERAGAEARAREQAAQTGLARDVALPLLARARSALNRGELDDARLFADKALTALGRRADLADLAAEAEQMRALSRRRLDERAAALDARRRYRRFAALRDEALFHASLFTGLDAVTNLDRARSAAEEALALFAVDGVPPLDAPGLTETERAEGRAGSAELLLTLAETHASPRPGQSAEDRRANLKGALRVLDRPGFLPTRAVHLRRARYRAELGDAAGADAERARATTREPSGAADCFLIGDERLRAGDAVGARADFEAALQREPGHFWARYALTLVNLKLERLTDARASLNACLARRPTFAWLYTLRGFVHGELGDFRSADADFARALDLTDEPATCYGALANRGLLRLREADAADALTPLRHAAWWFPAAGPLAAGAAAERDGNFVAAAEDLRAAVALRPTNYQAHVSLGRVRARQGQFAAARAAFDEALRLGPDLPGLYRARAEFARARHDLAAARDDLRRAIELERSSDVARANDLVQLGQLHQREEGHRPALAAADAALKLSPDHPGALRLRAVTLLGLGRYEDALGPLNAYLARKGPEPGGPPLAEAYLLRGLVGSQLGRYDEALADYTRALELRPDAATRTHRGWVYLASGAARPALADFEAALRIDGSLGDAHAGRGCALTRLGRPADAVQAAEAALRHGPRTARLLRNAASVYSRAAAANGGTADGPQEYRRRALDLLAAALTATPPERRSQFWEEQIRTEPDLESLRKLPAFRALAPQ